MFAERSDELNFTFVFVSIINEVLYLNFKSCTFGLLGAGADAEDAVLPDLEAVAASLKLDLKLETVELNAAGGAGKTAGLNISLGKASDGRRSAEDEDSLLEQLSGSGGTPPERVRRGRREEGLLWAEEEEEEKKEDVVVKGEVRTEPSNPEGVPEQLLGERGTSKPHPSPPNPPLQSLTLFLPMPNSAPCSHQTTATATATAIATTTAIARRNFQVQSEADGQDRGGARQQQGRYIIAIIFAKIK